MSATVRIAMVNLTGGGLSGGYRTYLRELVPRLAKHPAVTELAVALPPDSGFTSESLGAPCTVWPTGARRERWVRDFVRDHNADVVFIPTARWCDTGRPTAVMVRNMEALVRPWKGNSALDGVRNLLRRVAARDACRRADRVFAVSDFVRSFLEARWDIPRERICVVPHGVAKAPDAESLKRPDTIRADMGPFLFTAGSIRPARGLEDLIGAMVELADLPQLQLVVAGHVDAGARRYARRLRASAEAANIAGRITWAGALSTPAMSWCLTHAACFVMVSRVEACPNTVLEAMAHGSMSVSTTLPPMPEFFDDCATYYTAGDARGLADAVRRTLAMSSSERERFRLRARQRASRFTWEETADRTVRELRRTLGLPGAAGSELTEASARRQATSSK